MNTKKSFKTTENTEKLERDSFTGKINGCAIEVHRTLGLVYMKLSGINTSLLINFDVKQFKDGIERFKF